MAHYPIHRQADNVEVSPNFVALEEGIIAFWKQDNTFTASVENRAAGQNGNNEFVFYDGPPFANGLPHYGHLLTGYVKDTIGRFRTQLGKRVERRFGWDTHGLPAEIEAERILDIEDKSQIEGEGGVGIATFNDTCRNAVLRYTHEWEEYVTRQARWVDFSNDYKTLDLSYMESVIWAFKTLYDKGIAYEGYQVLPYCWNDETPLSNHELKMDDDVYQDRQDTTVTVGIRLESGELALIWTTTPWTLPSNLAIAVGPEIDYVAVAPSAGIIAGQTVILGADRLAAYAKELGVEQTSELTVVARYKGKDLVGKRYYPIFPYYDLPENLVPGAAPGPQAWQIISGEFVTTEDGTGIVHIAPAFGEDDMQVCLEANIKAVVPVDDMGKFTEVVSDYAGLQVFAANRPIINDLRDATGPLAQVDPAKRAVLVQEKSYVHAYPHCWRCRKPLIYKAVGSWFVAVTQIRERMVQLNQQINWVPSHLRDGQFGKWLAGARDWSISRNRFWGAPIPVWKSDDPNYPRVDVYGSLADIEADFGVKVTDLHRPFIDTLVRPNPDDPTGKSMMRRIPDVLDCWFESGSMPFAQVHYPFENAQWFENHYPGDFIVEYLAQTRGWFYTLHVLATALFDRPAFINCLSHGIVLGDDGKKMSKSLRNYPDVNEVFNTYGSDTMRWYLLSSPVVKGGNLTVTEKGIRDTVRQVLLPLWNVWYFYALYAGKAQEGAGYISPGVDLNSDHLANLHVMDRYLLARTKELVELVREQITEYEVANACESIRAYIDMLSNWYLRTSRDRFTAGELAAFDTLRTCLEAFVKVAAPMLPLLSEEIYKGLTGQRSVHITDWPQFPDTLADTALVSTMETVRDSVSVLHGLRKIQKIRVRQPLAKASVVLEEAESLRPFAQIIADEINLKEVELLSPQQVPFSVSQLVTPIPKTFDDTMRKSTQKIFQACKQGAWTLQGEEIHVHLAQDEQVILQSHQFVAKSVIDLGDNSQDLVADVLPAGGFVVLDITLDAQLLAEGVARDVVRAVQDERKAQGLEIGEQMYLALEVPSEDVAKIETYRDMIMRETSATKLKVSAGKALSITITAAE